MARLTRAMTRTATRSGALAAISRRKTINMTRPSGSVVRLGALTGVDMNTFWSGTRPTRGSNSLSWPPFTAYTPYTDGSGKPDEAGDATGAAIGVVDSLCCFET